MGEIAGVELTTLQIIAGESGDVLHAMKTADPGFCGFGEAYFSTVHENATKGWKKHRKMWLNLVVPVGRILFFLYDDRQASATYEASMRCELSRIDYRRLTVPPGVYMAFRGMAKGENILLNLASISHDPAEAENLPLGDEKFSGIEMA